MNEAIAKNHSRRDFLKHAGKTSALAAMGGIALAGCTSNSSNDAKDGVIEGHSNKKEILYRSTKYWSSYYASAK